MKEERLLELVSLKLAGEASAEQLAELDQLIKENPEYNFRVSLIEKVWKSQSNENRDLDNTFNKHLQRLSNHLGTPALQYEEPQLIKASPIIKKRSFRRPLLAISGIAASIMIVFATIHFTKITLNKSNFPKNTVSTKTGSKSKITLPDGSQVWLNAESKITYSGKFGDNTREVELSGEAYFDVVRDVTRPFIIHTTTIDVKVLGTTFNVRSYPDEKTAETSLIKGIVEVTIRNNPDKKIILKPNEKLVVQNEVANTSNKTIVAAPTDPILILSNVHYFKGDSSSIETSWIKNKLAFEGESLEDVANKIARWYGVSIFIKDERLKAGQYTGLFEDESLQEVLDALKLTGNFSYEINKKEVVIKQ